MKTKPITFGEAGDDGICYGCAATNAVCEISGITFDTNTIGSQSEAVGCDADFLDYFEDAIDGLRMGGIVHYNIKAIEIGITELPTPHYELPTLVTDDYLSNLHFYEEYAEKYCSKVKLMI